MKALTVYQPWATLLAAGEKRYETRDWYTGYRGELAIHAGKKWTPQLADLCTSCPFSHALDRILGPGWRPEDLPRGKIVGVGILYSCYSTTESTRAHVRRSLGNDELTFGDWSRGRYAWQINGPIALTDPIPARGMPGLWTPSNEAIEKALAALL